MKKTQKKNEKKHPSVAVKVCGYTEHKNINKL